MTTAMTGVPGGTGRAGRGRTDSTKRWNSKNPWYALWTKMIGFFMIMLDSTIVAIANPTIMADLRIG
jgi:hypothetical protein